MIQNNPNAQVYSSSTVMSYSNTGNGAPKIYQASTSTKQLPGGIRETRKAVKDSERGIEKVAVGHHIGEKAHVIERQRLRDGQMEELVNLENLDDSKFLFFFSFFKNYSKLFYYFKKKKMKLMISIVNSNNEFIMAVIIHLQLIITVIVHIINAAINR